jgi:hypothetical protein
MNEGQSEIGPDPSAFGVRDRYAISSANRALFDRSRPMSGSSHSGFTWKEVAEILRVCEISNTAMFRREIKRPKKRQVGAKRAPIGTKGEQRSSDRPQLRQPGASR